MSNPVIPAEAVEAAAKAVAATVAGDADSYPNEEDRALARVALEAAAVHLIREAQADAWEEGCKEGLSWNPGYDDKALAENPYRK